MAVTLDIKVVPRARKRVIKVDPVYDIRCYVTSPPEDNKANKEVIELLAAGLNLPKSAITLLAGQTSRIKRILIENYPSKNDILRQLNLEVQNALF